MITIESHLVSLLPHAAGLSGRSTMLGRCLLLLLLTLMTLIISVYDYIFHCDVQTDI